MADPGRPTTTEIQNEEDGTAPSNSTMTPSSSSSTVVLGGTSTAQVQPVPTVAPRRRMRVRQDVPEVVFTQRTIPRDLKAIIEQQHALKHKIPGRKLSFYETFDNINLTMDSLRATTPVSYAPPRKIRRTSFTTPAPRTRTSTAVRAPDSPVANRVSHLVPDRSIVVDPVANPIPSIANPMSTVVPYSNAVIQRPIPAAAAQVDDPPIIVISLLSPVPSTSRAEVSRRKLARQRPPQKAWSYQGFQNQPVCEDVRLNDAEEIISPPIAEPPMVEPVPSRNSRRPLGENGINQSHVTEMKRTMDQKLSREERGLLEQQVVHKRMYAGRSLSSVVARLSNGSDCIVDSSSIDAGAPRVSSNPTRKKMKPAIPVDPTAIPDPIPPVPVAKKAIPKHPSSVKSRDSTHNSKASASTSANNNMNRELKELVDQKMKFELQDAMLDEKKLREQKNLQKVQNDAAAKEHHRREWLANDNAKMELQIDKSDEETNEENQMVNEFLDERNEMDRCFDCLDVLDAALALPNPNGGI